MEMLEGKFLNYALNVEDFTSNWPFLVFFSPQKCFTILLVAF